MSIQSETKSLPYKWVKVFKNGKKCLKKIIKEETNCYALGRDQCYCLAWTCCKGDEDDKEEHFMVNLSVGTKAFGLIIKKQSKFDTIEEARKFYYSIDLETEDYMCKEIEWICNRTDYPDTDIVECEYHKDWEDEEESEDEFEDPCKTCIVCVDKFNYNKTGKMCLVHDPIDLMDINAKMGLTMMAKSYYKEWAENKKGVEKEDIECNDCEGHRFCDKVEYCENIKCPSGGYNIEANKICDSCLEEEDINVCCKCDRKVPNVYLGGNAPDELWVECICSAHSGWYCPNHSPCNDCFSGEECPCCG